MSSTVCRAILLLTVAIGLHAAEPANYIVVCSPVTDVDRFTTELTTQRGIAVGQRYQRALHGFAARLQDKDLNALRRDPRIVRIEPDITLHLPPTGIDRIMPGGKPDGGGGKPNKGGGETTPPPPQEIPNGIVRINAIGGRVPADIAVAIIDTGIPAAHPDLNVVGGASFVRGTDTWNDDNGHGGHVAGTIGARDNLEGVIGVAPGIPLYAIKVLNKRGSGSLSDIIAGIDWCISANATSNAHIRVINMSLGGSGYSASFEDAVNRAHDAGIVVVVAAGNENTDAGTTQPARFANVIAVSAIADSDGLPGGFGGTTNYGNDDTLAVFSNYGSAVDIAAPGVNILSTYKSGYAILTGTSMASPHVAGVCALAAGALPPPTAPDASWSNSVRNLVINGALPQADPNGFTGDKDNSAEPLLDANAAIVPAGAG